MINPVDMEVGKTYSVMLSDCCVEADFISKLIALEVCEGYLILAQFENEVSVTKLFQTVELVDADPT